MLSYDVLGVLAFIRIIRLVETHFQTNLILDLENNTINGTANVFYVMKGANDISTHFVSSN